MGVAVDHVRDWLSRHFVDRAQDALSSQYACPMEGGVVHYDDTFPSRKEHHLVTPLVTQKSMLLVIDSIRSAC